MQEQEIERYNQLAQARVAENLLDREESERLHRVVEKIRSIFRGDGETFSNEEAKTLLKDKPQEATFPILIFTIALIKDISDAGDLSGIGIIFTTLLSITISFILLIWCWNKISGGWWKKRMIKKILIRLGFCVVIEILPFGKIVPATTIFVLMAYYHETKIVKLLNLALEELHEAGFGK